MTLNFSDINGEEIDKVVVLPGPSYEDYYEDVGLPIRNIPQSVEGKSNVKIHIQVDTSNCCQTEEMGNLVGDKFTDTNTECGISSGDTEVHTQLKSMRLEPSDTTHRKTFHDDKFIDEGLGTESKANELYRQANESNTVGLHDCSKIDAMPGIEKDCLAGNKDRLNTDRESSGNGANTPHDNNINDDKESLVLQLLKGNTKGIRSPDDGCGDGASRELHEDRDKSRYKCLTCNTSFKTKFTLQRHQSSKHPTDWYKCDICSKPYPSEKALAAHKVKHDKSFVCKFENCGKVCKTERHLQLHQGIHDKAETLVCRTCGKVCQSQSKLLAHEQSHSTERLFKCEECGKSYKTLDVLTKHLRVHKSSYHIYCKVCGKGFNQTGSLQRHMDTHANIKRYKCDICHKTFSQKPALQVHKLNEKHYTESEMTEKMITCKVCDKTFPKDAKHLYEKHTLIHTGDKPYKCDVCDKQFNDRSNLNAHKKIHSDTKPFRCHLCNKSYIHRSHLNKHLQNHDKVYKHPKQTQSKNESSRVGTRKTKTIYNEYSGDKGVDISDKIRTDLVESSAISGQESVASAVNKEIANNATNISTVPTFSVLTPMSTLIPFNTPTHQSVSIPVNVVYDRSSILQLASMSAGVLDANTMFHQRDQTNTEQGKSENIPTTQNSEFTSGGSIANWSAQDFKQAPERENTEQATAEESEITHVAEAESDNEEHERTWKQMDKLFTCKSPKDIDHSHEGWM